MRSLEQIIGLYQADAPLGAGIDHSRRLVHRRRASWTWSAARCSRAWQLPVGSISCATPASTSPASSRRRAGGRRPRADDAARLLQRVPSPRRGGRDRARRRRTVLRCPYHGWTYGLDGELKGTPDFAGVCDFDRSANGLVPVEAAAWEKWVFVRLERGRSVAGAISGAELSSRLQTSRRSTTLHWIERRHYTLDCNWKVFVDNYLDGGYHVPHLHKGLDSVLDYSDYTIENGERFCLQSSPIVSDGAEARTGAVRQGDRAFYYWIYPNFMINCYGGAMDTNLVIPRGVDRTDVIFDFYFADVSERRARAQPARASRSASRSRMRTSRSARRCSAGCARGHTRRAGCRCAAKRGSTCSTGCSYDDLKAGLTRTRTPARRLTLMSIDAGGCCQCSVSASVWP